MVVTSESWNIEIIDREHQKFWRIADGEKTLAGKSPQGEGGRKREKFLIKDFIDDELSKCVPQKHITSKQQGKNVEAKLRQKKRSDMLVPTWTGFLHENFPRLFRLAKKSMKNNISFPMGLSSKNTYSKIFINFTFEGYHKTNKWITKEKLFNYHGKFRQASGAFLHEQFQLHQRQRNEVRCGIQELIWLQRRMKYRSFSFRLEHLWGKVEWKWFSLFEMHLLQRGCS